MVRVTEDLEMITPVDGITVPSQAVPPFVSVVIVAPMAVVAIDPVVVLVIVPPSSTGIVQEEVPVPEKVSVHEPMRRYRPWQEDEYYREDQQNRQHISSPQARFP